MKEILTYLTLVGFPILGLVGILRLGHALEASPAVYGVWVADSTAVVEPCSERVLRLFRAGITVQQSGRHLSASLTEDRDKTLSGRMVGDTVRLSGVVSDTRSEGAATCEPRMRIAPTLRLLPAESDGRRLSGDARIVDCASCTTMPVTFTIVPSPALGASPAVHR